MITISRQFEGGDPGINGKALPVFLAFLKLGFTSFGGPIAHIGYFREEFVIRRKWLSESLFSEIVALCQFLPGPTSSQVGFLIGLIRGGPLGALFAWIAFTAPSAIVMVSFAFGIGHINGSNAQAIIHGLKLVAVVIVAQAVWGMSRTLTPDRIRVVIALLSATVLLLSGQAHFQLVAILSGATIGIIFCRKPPAPFEQKSTALVSRSTAIVSLLLFFGIWLSLLTWSEASQFLGFVAKFFQSGSLVFGGGHVVLPLLEQNFVAPALIERSAFLAGYGATQAVPGPLFTFASYLGAIANNGPGGVLGGIIATISIFLPGILLVLGIVPFWEQLRENGIFGSAISGANAAVVGVLGAALYQPIWTSSVLDPSDFALVIFGYALIEFWRVPNWAVVILLPSATLLSSLAGL